MRGFHERVWKSFTGAANCGSFSACESNELCKGYKRAYLVLKLVASIIAEDPRSCLHPGLWNLYIIVNHSAQVVVLCSFHSPFTMT